MANRILVHCARTIRQGGYGSSKQQQLMFMRPPVPCAFVQSVRFESSLYPNHPNPNPEDLSDLLTEEAEMQIHPSQSHDKVKEFCKKSPINIEPSDELESWKDTPSQKITKYNIRKLEQQMWKEKYPHSFIEERLPVWYPWWTSRTSERTSRDPLVLPRAKEDLKYTRLAQFAISEYNKKENVHLEFVRVEGACLQRTCYSFYYIILEARDASAGGEKGLYRAKVLRDHDSKSIKFIRMVPMKQQPPALAKETKPSNIGYAGEEEKRPLYEDQCD